MALDKSTVFSAGTVVQHDASSTVQLTLQSRECVDG